MRRSCTICGMRGVNAATHDRHRQRKRTRRLPAKRPSRSCRVCGQIGVNAATHDRHRSPKRGTGQNSPRSCAAAVAKVRHTVNALLARGYFVTIGITTRGVRVRGYGYPEGVRLTEVLGTTLGKAKLIEWTSTHGFKGRARFLGRRGGNGYFGNRPSQAAASVYVAHARHRFRCNRGR